MRLLKKSSFIIVLVFLASCGNSKNIEKAEEGIPSVELLDNFDAFKKSASVSILGVLLEQNDLTISFTYSGGCEEHNFKLIGLRSLEKTLPPKRSIKLFHNSNNDSCRELITRSIKFDISLFGYKKDEYVLLNLEGWKDPIKYTLE
jgi:hypothetical protein